jgi:very-short-patch-repair endonuclease
MRRKPTPSEDRLHCALLAELKPFDVVLKSQEPISYYIADFMVYPQRVVIEIDGGYHKTKKQQSYDRRRDCSFSALGIRTLRIEARRVFYDLRGVIAEIHTYLGDLKPKENRRGEVKITYCAPAYASGHRSDLSHVNYGRFTR